MTGVWRRSGLLRNTTPSSLKRVRWAAIIPPSRRLDFPRDAFAGTSCQATIGVVPPGRAARHFATASSESLFANCPGGYGVIEYEGRRGGLGQDAKQIPIYAIREGCSVRRRCRRYRWFLSLRGSSVSAERRSSGTAGAIKPGTNNSPNC